MNPYLEPEHQERIINGIAAYYGRGANTNTSAPETAVA